MSQHVKRSTDFDTEIAYLRKQLFSAVPLPDETVKEVHVYLYVHDLERLLEILANNTTDSGCVVKAAADEPIFTLRANDPLFVPEVMNWIKDAIDNGWHMDKIEDAFECVIQAMQWRRRKK